MPQNTKSAQLRKLLSRKTGVTLEALCTTASWQPHSMRAFLSGLRKQGYEIAREGSGREAQYRITALPETDA